MDKLNFVATKLEEYEKYLDSIDYDKCDNNTLTMHRISVYGVLSELLFNQETEIYKLDLEYFHNNATRIFDAVYPTLSSVVNNNYIYPMMYALVAKYFILVVENNKIIE